ncbi:MAG: hypothetical protein H0W25_09660 [Acidimicrobiia bacterium]|nr:hypothetical protein [Acidimicrobiia bacterium]
MRWGRRSVEQAAERPGPPTAWHEGAHWVAGAGAVVHAERAVELVAGHRDATSSQAA